MTSRHSIVPMPAAIALMILLAAGCGPQGDDADAANGDSIDAADADPVIDTGNADADIDTGDAPASEGTIRMLTYNVAGMPPEIAEVNGTNPAVNMPKIAPLLNSYDLVLVQEDFWYHADLEAGTAHPYKSAPMWATPDWDRFGDGLNTFSVTPMSPVTRVAWEVCNGLVDSGGDCMTNKGIMWARHEIAPGVFIDVYDLHMDASGDPEDISARQVQGAQLAAFVAAHSEGTAVLMAGDTNLKASRPEDLATLETLLAAAGLTDSCRALSCGDERIDRVMFRGSAALELEPVEWRIPAEFVDADGAQLSDHAPVSVVFRWKVNGR